MPATPRPGIKPLNTGMFRGTVPGKTQGCKLSRQNVLCDQGVELVPGTYPKKRNPQVDIIISVLSVRSKTTYTLETSCRNSQKLNSTTKMRPESFQPRNHPNNNSESIINSISRKHLNSPAGKTYSNHSSIPSFGLYCRPPCHTTDPID